MEMFWRSKTRGWMMAGLASVAIWGGIPALASAQDSFTQAVVTQNAGPGESITVNKTLHLDAQPAFADIVLAIDTTGSMQPAIDQAKAEAAQLCTDIKAQIPGARFAVVDFKDYPTLPEAELGDYPYLNKTPGFVADCATVQLAIDTMMASGGGDLAEPYNRVFFEAYSDPLLVYNPQPLKFLIVLGDAPPHDPTQTAAPSCGDQPPVDPGRDGIVGTADDLETEAVTAGLNANSINLFMVFYNTGNIPFQCYEQLVVAAGGTEFDVVFGGSAGALSNELVQAVLNKASEIRRINLVVSPGCPLTFSFNPAFPRGPFTAPVNINFVETITAPTTGGAFSCTVTAEVDGVNRATEINNITVVAAPPPPCEVDKDDYDHDGIRDDTDIDDDNDGMWDNMDNDDDNDGCHDNDDDDDDNDCIKDEWDSKSTHELMYKAQGLTRGRHDKRYSDYSIVALPGTLKMVGVVQAQAANLLSIELFNAAGHLVARSVPSPGRAVVTATGLLPGAYVMRVRTTSPTPIPYNVIMLTSIPW